VSTIERYRFALYVVAVLAGIGSALFPLWYVFMNGLLLLAIFALAIFALAIISSCAHHWRQQSKKAKILTNVAQIFFWTIIVTYAVIIILLILALLGMPPGE
jgi:hypothetical protein